MPQKNVEKKQDEAVAQTSADDHAEKEEKVVIEYESDPVDSALCIQLFCIEEKFEMRFVLIMPSYVFLSFSEYNFRI